MQVDLKRLPPLTDEERKLIARVRKVRTIAAVAIVSGITAIGFMAGPRDAASVAAAPDGALQQVVPADPGLLALERGPIG